MSTQPRDTVRTPSTEAFPDLDERFVFDFQASEDPDEGQRFSTWLSVEPLCRGPGIACGYGSKCATRYAGVECLGDFEPDRAETRDCDAHRRWLRLRRHGR